MTLEALNVNLSTMNGAKEAMLNHQIGNKRNRVLDGFIPSKPNGTNSIAISSGNAIINGYHIRRDSTLPVTFTSQGSGTKYLALIANPNGNNSTNGKVGTTSYKVFHEGVAIAILDAMPTNAYTLVLAELVFTGGVLPAGSLTLFSGSYDRFADGTTNRGIALRTKQLKEIALGSGYSDTSPMPVSLLTGSGKATTSITFKSKANDNGVSNGNTPRRGNITTTTLPAPFTIPAFSTQAARDAIMKLDTVNSLQSTAVVGATPLQEFDIDIYKHLESMYPTIFAGATTPTQKMAVVKNVVTEINAVIYGYGSGGGVDGMQSYVYNFPSGSWDTQTLSNASTTAMPFKCLLTTGTQFSNAINDNGIMALMIAPKPMVAGGTQCLNYVDYVSTFVSVDLAKIKDAQYVNDYYLAPTDGGFKAKQTGIYRISVTGKYNVGDSLATNIDSSIELRAFVNFVRGQSVPHPNRPSTAPTLEINLHFDGILKARNSAITGSVEVMCWVEDTISVEVPSRQAGFTIDSAIENLSFSIEYLGYSSNQPW